MNCEYPLGLPQGSVRALLALGITFSSVVALLLGKIDIQTFTTLNAVVIGFYFTNRP